MKEISLSSKKYPNMVALVDDEDFDKVSAYNWTISNYRGHMYAVVWTKGKNRKQLKLHRFIMEEGNPNTLIDHKDGNGLNNQKNNLRRASHKENRWNSKGCGKVVYVGVTETGNNTYKATIRDKGKELYLGTYKTPEEAAKKRDMKAIEIHGEFAKLNFY